MVGLVLLVAGFMQAGRKGRVEEKGISGGYVSCLESKGVGLIKTAVLAEAGSTIFLPVHGT